jgi:RHS repeat-associated protein
VYIYLSNEETTPVEVYFDDFRVTHVKSPVIQTDDYYPFGLTFNSFSRENSVPNKFKLQGQEHIDDLNLGWVSFKWRNHQPDIGRFFNVDPLAEKFYYNSPYAFSENKVTHHIELEGLEAMEIGLLLKVAEFKARTAGSVSNIQSAGGRLVSGNSGNVPSEVPMSDGDRQMVKLGSQISDAKMVTDGVKDITKTGVRMGAEEAQNMGDAIETAGVVTAQPEIAALGKGISMTGKGVEMAMDASEGNLTTGDVAYEVGKEVVFSGMGNAAEKGVKAGNLDKKAGDIFQVFVKGWEMLTDWGKSVVDDSNKKK